MGWVRKRVAVELDRSISTHRAVDAYASGRNISEQKRNLSSTALHTSTQVLLASHEGGFI